MKFLQENFLAKCIFDVAGNNISLSTCAPCTMMHGSAMSSPVTLMLLFTIFCAGAGESGKSTFVKQMK